MAKFRRRLAGQIRFRQDRLSPEGYLGLHLTVGALVITAACWWFAGITEKNRTANPLTVIDKQAATWFHEHATPGLSRTMGLITFIGSAPWIAGIALATALFLVWRRDGYRLLALVLTVPGGGLLNVLIRHALHRERPWFGNAIIRLSGYGFPSGHTMGATLLYGLLAAFAVSGVKPWRERVLTVLGPLFARAHGWRHPHLSWRPPSQRRPWCGGVRSGLADLLPHGGRTLRRYRIPASHVSERTKR